MVGTVGVARTQRADSVLHRLRILNLCATRPILLPGGIVRRLSVCGLAASFAGLALTSAAYGQPGQLDPSFGGDGKVTTDVTTRGDFAAEVATQADGKIVVVGGARWERDTRFVLVRYNADGTLDTTFGGDGKVTTNFTSRLDAAWDVAIQSDGKIVAVGDAGFRTGNSRFAVARYNTDGTLDTSFGGDGKVTTQFTRHDDPVAGVALQADGKIVVSGGANWGGGESNFALARYNTDGTLDATFSGDGKVTTDFARRGDYANAVVVQADGKLVAGGYATYSRTNGRNRFAVARYNAEGTLDTTFSGDGKQTTDFTRRNDPALDLTLQLDGKIVAAGISNSDGSNPNVALARYNADGTLDASFSGDGKVTTDFTGGYDQAYAVALQPDGKVVVGGAAAGLGGRFLIARYDTSGALDSTFNGGGFAETDFTRHDDFVYGLAVQADANFVLAGGSGWGGSNPRIALARYLGT
jgi:uncharacterized delta-60 repeat protein